MKFIALSPQEHFILKSEALTSDKARLMQKIRTPRGNAVIKVYQQDLATYISEEEEVIKIFTRP